MDSQQLEAQFISLVYTFHQTAMFALGKMANPMTGKVERVLPQAKNAIDTLEMVAEKTKGNLSEKEDKFLKNILQELRLNYVYEVEHEKNQPQPEVASEEEKVEAQPDTSGEEEGAEPEGEKDDISSPPSNTL